MTDRKERDVQGDVFKSIQKEDHAEQKEQMVVAGDHVLRSEIQERDELHPAVAREKGLIRLVHVVCEGEDGEQQRAQSDNTGERSAHPDHALGLKGARSYVDPSRSE